MTIDIKVFKDNDKLIEAYDRLVEFINRLNKEYQLSYFELFGILEAFRSDLIKTEICDEEDGE